MRWEYKTVTTAMTAGELDALGAEGWELVSVVSPVHAVLHHFFKRELKE